MKQIKEKEKLSFPDKLSFTVEMTMNKHQMEALAKHLETRHLFIEMGMDTTDLTDPICGTVMSAIIKAIKGK